MGKQDAKECPWCQRWWLKDNACAYIFACGLDHEDRFYVGMGCGKSWCWNCGKKYCGQYYNPETGDFTRIAYVRNHMKDNSKVGFIDPLGYYYTKINNIKIGLHRLAFLYMEGFIPDMVDHIDGNPSNNKWDNLRVCTAIQNQCNAKIRVDNKTGVKGISYKKGHKKPYVPRLTINKVRHSLGTYETLEEAKQVLEYHRDKFHKEFAKHN